MAMRTFTRSIQAAARRWHGLSAAAEAELGDEASILESLEKPSAPTGWSLEKSDSGNGYFRLKSSSGDVIVDCELKAHAAEGTGFTVFVTRNGVTGDFSMRYSADDGCNLLEGMTTYKSKDVATALTADAAFTRENHYEGPNVEDLKETELIEKTFEFLEAQGISNELGEYVHKHVQVLEQKEYMNLLTDLKALAA